MYWSLIDSLTIAIYQWSRVFHATGISHSSNDLAQWQRKLNTFCSTNTSETYHVIFNLDTYTQKTPSYNTNSSSSSSSSKSLQIDMISCELTWYEVVSITKRPFNEHIRHHSLRHLDSLTALSRSYVLHYSYMMMMMMMMSWIPVIRKPSERRWRNDGGPRFWC